jgi:hypothetical protein
VTDLIRIFSERGDLAHLALLLWAGSASALLYLLLRAFAIGMGRIDDFVREMARFNQRHGGRHGNPAQGDASDPRRDKIAPRPLERIPRIPRPPRPRRQARQARARRPAREGKEQA